MGTTFNNIIKGQKSLVPVGKPVVIVQDKHGNQVPIYHEQCAEAWPGVNRDGSVNACVQKEQRYINTLAKKYQGLLILNPSGSKNDVSYPKTLVRKTLLCRAALDNNPNISGYMYVNIAGDDNGTVGGDADSYILGKNNLGEPITLQGKRHTLLPLNFSSMVIAILKIAPQTADVLVNLHDATFNKPIMVGITNDDSNSFALNQFVDEKMREYTDTIFATSAWILNTLRHHKKQCFIISLSGGADSTFSAVQIVTAIDLFIQESSNAAIKNSGLSPEKAKCIAITELFNEYFSHLNCKESLLNAMSELGADATIKRIKEEILVCVYMPTANSSEDTLLSAKTLITGGPCYALDKLGRLIKPLQETNGDVEGLGGRFIVSDLQKPLEAHLLAYTGKTKNLSLLLSKPKFMQALDRQRHDWHNELANIQNNDELFEKIIVLFSEGKIYDKNEYDKRQAAGVTPLYVFPVDLLALISKTPPTWWDKSHDLAKQNLQPRLRSICPWLLASLYDGLPLFTSNLSEAAAGYSTWAGDTSLGYENSLGGILKSDVRNILLLFEKGKLCGLSPKPSLFYVNNLEPSAELRPLDKKGMYTQTDEEDLMPYVNLDHILCAMILEKRTPWQTFKTLRYAVDSKSKPLFKNDEECILQIHRLCWLYQTSQFKRTGCGNTPFLGRNLDPHTTEATTLLASFFTNGLTELNLKYCAEKNNLPFDEKKS